MAMNRSMMPKQIGPRGPKGPTGPNPAKGNRVAVSKPPAKKPAMPLPFKKGGMTRGC